MMSWFRANRSQRITSPMRPAVQRRQIVIGGKLVWPSEPYAALRAHVGPLIGREDELAVVTAAWMGSHNPVSSTRVPPLAPLLVGEPGVGKNRLVYELAERSQRKLFILQGHEDVTSEDLACTVRFSDGSDSRMDYVISPLMTAMQMGGICFIDEIGKIRPRALALLVSVLDERRYLDSTLLGERVHAHPNFRFIAATNTGEILEMPEFIQSRMRPVIQVGLPSRQELLNVLSSQFPHLAERIRLLGDRFFSLWEKRAQEDGPAPSARDAIYVFSLADSLAELERLRRPSGHRGSSNGGLSAPCAGLEPRHLDRAFDQLFHGSR